MALATEKLYRLNFNSLGLLGRAASRQKRTFFFRAAPQPSVLYSAWSPHNQISVVEVPDAPGLAPPLQELAGARILLLDGTGNIHSMWKPNSYLTGSYWDLMAAMPAATPPGKVAILGLGAGTVARTLHHFFPERSMEGWELDAAVVMAGRCYLGLQAVEDDGKLVVHTGDALAAAAAAATGSGPSGFSAVIVDLFAHGRLLPALAQVDTWRAIRGMLSPDVPGARVMANLGQAGRADDCTAAALEAMAEAFDGELSCLDFQSDSSHNTMALTGPREALQERWAAGLPLGLQHLTSQLKWS